MKTATTTMDLADAVVADGFDSHAAAVDALLECARDRGCSPVLIEVCADPAEPHPARLRALGRLLAAVARPLHPEPGAPAVPSASSRRDGVAAMAGTMWRNSMI